MVTDEKDDVIKKNKSFADKLFSPKEPMASRKALPFKAFDWIVMISIMLVYAFFAFADLGDTTVPETKQLIPSGEVLELSAPEGSYISYFGWCLMDSPNFPFMLETKNYADSEWTVVDNGLMENDFGCWSLTILPNPAEQIRITYGSYVVFREVALYDLYANVVLPKNSSEYPYLFDEQNLIPETFSYLNCFYFDEMLYGLTAYEFIIGMPAYEITHPPFGKILISLGILLLGYNPVGIRLVGVLVGVLMLPCLYLLGRNVTRNRGISAFATFLFAFDFMHYTQTRIATVDIFVVFFIILMYYFMERYLNLSFYDTSLKKTWIPLGCCGVAFGFCVATKWTGFYAGAGLALLFFCRIFGYYREYRYALLAPEEVTNDIPHAHIISTFKKNVIKTILFCLVFYIVIPFIIYLLSYIPFIHTEGQGLFSRMVENQKFMFNFHSNETFEHPYTSRWYEWPIMVRPICYYTCKFNGIARQSITAFGNPLVWWAGIPAFVFTLYMAIGKKQRDAAFLCIGYLAQYVPWMFISRPTFIYHYFTCVPFIVLMMGYCAKQIKLKLDEKKILDNKSFYCLLIIYAAAAFGLFQLFLPVLTGTEVSFFYVDDYLSWFKSWEFIIH